MLLAGNRRLRHPHAGHQVVKLDHWTYLRDSASWYSSAGIGCPYLCGAPGPTIPTRHVTGRVRARE